MLWASKPAKKSHSEVSVALAAAAAAKARALPFKLLGLQGVGVGLPTRPDALAGVAAFPATAPRSPPVLSLASAGLVPPARWRPGKTDPGALTGEELDGLLATLL